MRTSSFWPDHFCKLPPLKTITLEVRIPKYQLWGDINIQSITYTVAVSAHIMNVQFTEAYRHIKYAHVILIIILSLPQEYRFLTLRIRANSHSIIKSTGSRLNYQGPPVSSPISYPPLWMPFLLYKIGTIICLPHRHIKWVNICKELRKCLAHNKLSINISHFYCLFHFPL